MGRNLMTRGDWSWRDSHWETWGRDARLRATSPTNGPWTWVVVGEQGEEHFW
jgi:hypothetical protein